MGVFDEGGPFSDELIPPEHDNDEEEAMTDQAKRVVRPPQNDDVDLTVRVSRRNLPALFDGVSGRVALREIEPGVYGLDGILPAALPNPIEPKPLGVVDDLFFGGGDEPMQESGL